ncbi:MAG TPA: molybdopterin dehydrogenase, partial [Desulfovibrio sp.]|nr:molybdopterin dehydrogenase [Desulfovibrio sp.]
TITDGKVSTARICLNGVHNNPRRCETSEEALIGNPLSEGLATQAGELAVAEAKPLFQNIHKVQMSKTIVADTLLECAR